MCEGEFANMMNKEKCLYGLLHNICNCRLECGNFKSLMYKVAFHINVFNI